MRCGESQTVPDFGLAELGAVGLGDERVDDTVDRVAAHAADELHPGGDVAPLVAAAGLQLAAGDVVQVQEVVRLEQHVAELGEGNAVLALEARAHRILGDHVVDGEMLADIPQEIHQVERKQPIGIVHHPRRVGFDVEIKEMGQLGLDRLDIGLDDLLRKQLAFGGLAAGVADHAGAAARQGDGMVAEALQAGQGDQGDKAADMQAVAGSVEAVVDDLFLGSRCCVPSIQS